MTTRNKFSPEVRDRAVRMVGDHRADYGVDQHRSGTPLAVVANY